MQNQVPVSQNRPVTGRFAPSPSGRLHLGNLACSLLAWLSARSRGGRIVLRIEDLDAERCPRVYADLLEQDLAWLGLTWDEGGSTGGAHAPYYQSECGDIYTQSYRKLEQKGLVYPCFCSRSQLHAASAPHTSDGNVIYPGTCRGLTAAEIAEKRKKKAKEEVLFPTPVTFGNENKDLFEELRILRKKLADQQAIPAYIVLSDKTLHLIATQQPTTIEAFGNINGIGEYKKEKYGKEFIELIKKVLKK